jgi:hypothetical protein
MLEAMLRVLIIMVRNIIKSGAPNDENSDRSTMQVFCPTGQRRGGFARAIARAA